MMNFSSYIYVFLSIYEPIYIIVHQTLLLSTDLLPYSPLYSVISQIIPMDIESILKLCVSRHKWSYIHRNARLVRETNRISAIVDHS